MTDCRRTIERLTPYVDQQLPAAEQAEVARHIAACPPCRVAAMAEQGGRTVLRETSERLRSETLPPGLRGRCEALAREHARPEDTRAWRLRLMPVSLSGVLVLFTAVALFSLATHRSDTLLAAQLTADHAKCFRLFADPTSTSADSGRLEQMLRDEYGWDVHVPPSSELYDVQLIGARRCLYADGRLPHIMYRVKGRDMSLYMLEGTSRHAAVVTSLGHRSYIRSRAGTTYVLVAPEDAGDLTAAVQYVMQDTHSRDENDSVTKGR